jgi:hypothetical protein
MTLESKFKRETINKIKEMFPECVVLKNDANYMQGIPDTLVLFKDRWAMLEFKRESDSHVQPNQSYFVDKLDRMSIARFIYPENKEEVLSELQQAFESRRTSRISRRK